MSTKNGLDKDVTGRYNKRRKGAAGKRSAPLTVKEVTAVLCGLGRLLLVMQLNKQAAKADDNQAKLQGLRKSHLARPPLRWTCWVCAGKEEGKKSPSQRTRGAEPPTVMAALKATLSCQYFNRIGGNCQQKTSLTTTSGGGIMDVERALPAGGRLP